MSSFFMFDFMFNIMFILFFVVFVIAAINIFMAAVRSGKLHHTSSRQNFSSSEPNETQKTEEKRELRCPYCGAPIHKDDKNCEYCGVKL